MVLISDVVVVSIDSRFRISKNERKQEFRNSCRYYIFLLWVNLISNHLKLLCYIEFLLTTAYVIKTPRYYAVGQLSCIGDFKYAALNANFNISTTVLQPSWVFTLDSPLHFVANTVTYLMSVNFTVCEENLERLENVSKIHKGWLEQTKELANEDGKLADIVEHFTEEEYQEMTSKFRDFLYSLKFQNLKIIGQCYLQFLNTKSYLSSVAVAFSFTFIPIQISI